jgi:competence protein ComEA
MFEDDRLQPVENLREWLDASPAEFVGLAVLLTGGALLAGMLWWTGTPRPIDATPGLVPIVSEEQVTAEIVVHVTGAVRVAGIVRLPEGARIVDAIAASGGTRPDAVLDGLNLARPLSDGEQVFVPTAAETEAPGSTDGASAGAWRPDGKLDLNRATAADLEELPGIGPVIAERIVAWREQNGPFASVGQLREVSGIGERTLQRLADHVTV